VEKQGPLGDRVPGRSITAVGGLCSGWLESDRDETRGGLGEVLPSGRVGVHVQ
jgi:hypothetical protein